uniref:Putative tail protein n=1 Tax=viral metagenome TaxID=1070528 RepID=A0A6M3IZ91_9ZZZZ
MKVSPIQNSFAAGEVSPLLDGRTDISKYYSSVKEMENFIILPQGGVRRRPGTYFVAATKSNKAARLISFQFSTTQSYILEFTDQLMRVYKDNGIVLGNGSAYELATPYLEADLFNLQYVQDADTMWIVHPTYKPQKLTRSAHATWTLTNYAPTLDPFTSANNYPSAVTIFEQRIYFANTNTSPHNIWASVSGDYEDMTTGVNAGDAFIYEMGSQEVNAIRWLSSGKVILMGTLGGIFSMSSGSDQLAITPTNVSVKLETTYGATNLVPRKIGNYVYYIQRNLTTVRETAYSYNENEYKALDMTILAPHITGDAGIVDMAYQQSPYNILWCVRSDGEIAALTREIDQEVIAWSRQILGGKFTGIASQQAVVESVAVIPGDDGHDQVWFVVKRTINGGTVRYVEYLKPMDYGTEQEDAFYVDSGLSLDSPKTITAITKADPGVVTATSHGFSNGNIVIIRGVVGMTEVNRVKFLVASKTDHTFELNAAGDAIDVNVKALIHCDGTDGSQEFSDAATSKAITANGSVQVDTQYSKFGGASGLFNGTTDYLSLAYSSDWPKATDNFSIDFQARWKDHTTSSNIQYLYSQRDDGTHMTNFLYNTNKLQFECYDGAVVLVFTVPFTPTDGVFYHIELTRSGNSWYIFINGVEMTKTLVSGAYACTLPTLSAGIRIGDRSNDYFFNGNLDEYRISVGVARHTADFTVPAEPYAVSANIDTTDYGTYVSGGEVRKCVTTLSGLGHLEGESLDIFIDGIIRTDVTVASAAVTISDPTNGGGEIHTGLNYVSTLKTMRIEAGSAQGTAQSKLKRMHKAYAMLYKSLGMNMGNDDTQDSVEFSATDDFISEYSGWKDIFMPSVWDRDGFIKITQDGPAPLNLMSIVMYMVTSDQ